MTMIGTELEKRKKKLKVEKENGYVTAKTEIPELRSSENEMGNDVETIRSEREREREKERERERGAGSVWLMVMN